MKDFVDESCRDFAAMLASSSAAPGGGGAAALSAALGGALGEMVAALTLGKKSYIQVEEEILAAARELEQLRRRLLDMVQEDARGFEPLAAVYRLPKDSPQREDMLEAATLKACQAPVEIMELGCRALELVAVMAEKGSRLAVSDAGCAAALLKAALDCAALNVYINTASLKDRERARELNSRCIRMQERWGAEAERVYSSVKEKLL